MTTHPPVKFRLPLFPLPVVLFPGAPIPLHIFEPRYRRMVARCLETDRRFGLLYHDADIRGPFLSEEGRVGCVAVIEDFQPLPDGRSLLVARGEERFAIDDGIESPEPWFEAVVAALPDAPEATDALHAGRARSLALFREVLRALPEDPGALPELDPTRELSFSLARTVRVDPPWQQAFLELTSELRRLERLDALFRAVLGG